MHCAVGEDGARATAAVAGISRLVAGGSRKTRAEVEHALKAVRRLRSVEGTLRWAWAASRRCKQAGKQWSERATGCSAAGCPPQCRGCGKARRSALAAPSAGARQRKPNQAPRHHPPARLRCSAAPPARAAPCPLLAARAGPGRAQRSAHTCGREGDAGGSASQLVGVSCAEFQAPWCAQGRPLHAASTSSCTTSHTATRLLLRSPPAVHARLAADHGDAILGHLAADASRRPLLCNDHHDASAAAPARMVPGDAKRGRGWLLEGRSDRSTQHPGPAGGGRRCGSTAAALQLQQMGSQAAAHAHLTADLTASSCDTSQAQAEGSPTTAGRDQGGPGLSNIV